MNIFILNKAHYFKGQLKLKSTLDLKWYWHIRPLLKIPGKWPAPCIAPKSTKLAQLSFNSQIRQNVEYCCHMWAKSVLSSISNNERIQLCLQELVGSETFPLSNLLFTEAAFQTYGCSVANSMANIQRSLFLSATSFTTMTRIATSISLNHPYSLSIQLFGRKIHPNRFFPKN